MLLARWDPFRELNSLENQFNRIFATKGRAWATPDPSSRKNWSPNVDIFESKNELVLKVELAGITPDDVELQFEKNILTISGERRLENETEKDNYHRIERAYGGFSRSLSLPTSIEEDKILAEFKDGVLTITLPKQERAKARLIKIAS